MNAKLAEQRGLKPLGIFRGFAVAGCNPDEMGIGPVFAIPKVLKRLGLSIKDIDLWELNEAFAVQVLYCADTWASRWTSSTSTAARCRRPSVRHERPASGRADRRQTTRRETVCATMCIGGGMGAAGDLEVA